MCLVCNCRSLEVLLTTLKVKTKCSLQMDTMAANSASDMWAFGCIAYELLTGKEIYGAQYTDEEVMAMLIGYVSLAAT